MDDLYWKSRLKWMIWGENPPFSETPSITPEVCWLFFSFRRTSEDSFRFVLQLVKWKFHQGKLLPNTPSDEAIICQLHTTYNPQAATWISIKYIDQNNSLVISAHQYFQPLIGTCHLPAANLLFECQIIKIQVSCTIMLNTRFMFMTWRDIQWPPCREQEQYWTKNTSNGW